MLERSRTVIQRNRAYKLCNGPEHTRSTFQGLRGDLRSCVMKDSSRYCFLDRCSSLRGGEEELHLPPNVRGIV